MIGGLRAAGSIQNNSGLPQGPADPAPGRLKDAANRLSRGSRWPVYDGGGTWGGSRMLDLRRRDFIMLLGGVCAAWPLAARARQGDRVRRIGVLLPANPDDTEYQARVGAFLQGLQQGDWSIGRNVRIDTRWAGVDADAIRQHGAELARSEERRVGKGGGCE